MARFPSAGHLASWAGMCLGNHESAGKRLSGKTRKGNAWLRKLLIEVAHAAARSKNTYLSAQYNRLASRRGKKKAAIAVGHTILVIIYHILRDQQVYREAGGNYFDEQDRQSRNGWCADWRSSVTRFRSHRLLLLPKPYFSEEYQRC